MTVQTKDPLTTEIDIYMIKHHRLWRDRFFRATIKSVVPGLGNAWRVTVLPYAPADVANAPITLACALPEYNPQVGDDVECVWRDENSGWVFAPVYGVQNSGLPTYAEVTGDQTLINGTPSGNPVLITGLSKVVTPLPGRLIKVEAYTRVGSSVAGDQITVYIYKDGALFQQFSMAQDGSTTTPVEQQRPMRTDVSPSPVPHTYDVRATRTLSTSVLISHASSNSPAQLLIDDTGPAPQ